MTCYHYRAADLSAATMTGLLHDNMLHRKLKKLDKNAKLELFGEGSWGKREGSQSCNLNVIY